MAKSRQVGSLWPTKTGNGLNGTISLGIFGEKRVTIMKNDAENPHEKAPTHKIIMFDDDGSDGGGGDGLPF